MTPKSFIQKFKPAALQAQRITGLHYLISLAQAALEGGWGEHAPGNNHFGVKDSDGVNGNEQLLTTTEYSKSKTLKFPQIISIVWDNTKKLWKYRVKDWFRKYEDGSEIFIEHANFFKTRPRYAKAWAVRNDPNKFFEEISKAGYATAPDYSKMLKDISKLIQNTEKIYTL